MNDLLTPRQYLRLPATTKPQLMVVIDTEEEFAWGEGFLRQNTSVASMRGIHGLQAVFDEFGIVPTYVCDYPIATQPLAYEPLRSFLDDGRAVIGAHLHPWVNPPYTEELSDKNSYPGNIPAPIERDKIAALTDALEASFGQRPTIYKAGRYGIGPNTQAALEELGYDYDLSVYPYTDLRADHGPDFSRFPPQAYWFGKERKMLEIPVTNGFVGFAARRGASLTRFAMSGVGRKLRTMGILSRTGMLERLRLSPEGLDFEHHQKLTRGLLKQGLRLFTFSFHSPSCSPGFTPYVRTKADLARFLETCRRYFDFFLRELEGAPATPASIRAQFDPTFRNAPATAEKLA